MDDETITIPKSAIKVLRAQAIMDFMYMANITAKDIMAHMKAAMAHDLAEKILEQATFEVCEIDLGTRFRVTLKLLEM